MLFPLLISSCVKMRDYLGTKNGCFGVNIKKGIGKGKLNKDYLVIKDNLFVSLGDTKREIKLKIGNPDTIIATKEGYESWVYKSIGLKLIFDNNRLIEWEKLQ